MRSSIVGARIVAAVVVVLGFLTLVGVPAAVSYSQQQFTLTTESGLDYVGFGQDYRMVAVLPPTLSDDVYLPVTVTTDGSLVYQGEKPLRSSVIGNHVAFTTHAIGGSGLTFTQVTLIRMTVSQAERIQNQHRFYGNPFVFIPTRPVTPVADKVVTVVGV